MERTDHCLLPAHRMHCLCKPRPLLCAVGGTGAVVFHRFEGLGVRKQRLAERMKHAERQDLVLVYSTYELE